MRKVYLGLLILLGLNLPAQSQETAPADAEYAFGMDVAKNLKQSGILIRDPQHFLKGFKDAMEGKPLKFTDEEAKRIINDAVTKSLTKRNEVQQVQGKKYLEVNKKNPEVQTTFSGLQFEILKPGLGPKPQIRDQVKVHYRGTFIDGQEFDSSYKRGAPATFPLDGVIPGWVEGLQLMSVGSKFRLTLPPELGYGAQGAGSIVPPNSVLIFEVELLEIIPYKKPKVRPR